MKVIKNRKGEDERSRRSEKENPPLVFVHGSYHAAWCCAEHWLPFFYSSGFDSYAISLLGTTNAFPELSEALLVCSVPPSGNSYLDLMKESSRMPLFDLKKLNASLSVPKPTENSTKVVVVGKRTKHSLSLLTEPEGLNLGICIKPEWVMVLQDGEGLKETGLLYDVEPVCIEGVAHDMMLDCSWDKGAEVLLNWLTKPGTLSV